MGIPITQWEAIGGVAHAWIAQCEGYVSLCGREVSGLQGQRSGIRCAQCTASSGWAEQTGESSYLTPQQPYPIVSLPPMVAREPIIMGTRALPTRPKRHAKPIGAPVISPSVDRLPAAETPHATEAVSPLAVPDSMERYHLLPITEQQYWAPLMLARAGQDAVWNQDDETAAQFQQRCYQQLMGDGHA